MVIKRISIGGALLLFALALPFQGPAQPASQDPYPLRPVDTSSPRDTLRSFLANANQAIQRMFAGVTLDYNQTRRRAVETLDFSEVLDRHLVTTQVRHGLLLKEILDRIALPRDALIRYLLVTRDLVIRRQRDSIQNLLEHQGVLHLRRGEIAIREVAEI